MLRPGCNLTELFFKFHENHVTNMLKYVAQLWGFMKSTCMNE